MNNGQQMTREQYEQYQKIQIVVKRVAYIKSELHTAMNVQSLNARVREILDVLEYYFTGSISDAQPNIVPGTPASILDDPTKTKVEFTAGPGAVQQHQQRMATQAPGWQPTPDPFAPAAHRPLPQHSFAPSPPVNSSDVQFIPGPPPGVSTGVGNGQTVEYRDVYGRLVDANGVPIGQQAAPFPPPPAPNTPVSNQPQEIRANVQTRPTEAGGQVIPPPPTPPTGFMSSPAAGEIFPGNPAPPPVPGAPTTLEQARQVLPIPVMEG